MEYDSGTTLVLLWYGTILSVERMDTLDEYYWVIPSNITEEISYYSIYIYSSYIIRNLQWGVYMMVP